MSDPGRTLNSSSAAPPRGGSDDEIVALSAEAARTRDRMRENLAELRERIRPAHVTQHAADAARRAASDAGYSVAATAAATAAHLAGRARDSARTVTRHGRGHPLAATGAAAAGAGAAWALTRWIRRRHSASPPVGWPKAETAPAQRRWPHVLMLAAGLAVAQRWQRGQQRRRPSEPMAPPRTRPISDARVPVDHE